MARLASRFVLGLVFTLALAACGDSDVPVPEQTTQQLMALDVQPTADIFWGAVGSVSELIDGVPVYREYQPETDEEWAAVAAAAAKLRDHGKTLATPAYSTGRADDWLVFAQGLQDVATRAEQVTLAKDREAMLEVGGTLYNVCAACHRFYPAAEIPFDADLGNRPMQGLTPEQLQSD